MDYLAHLAADSRAVVEAAMGQLDKRVRACPDWTVGDLVGHLGRVQQYWAGLVERRQKSEPDGETPVPETPNSIMLLEWFVTGSERLVEALADADPQEQVWTWWPPDQSAGFWRRRMAQEAAVHRWDVQDAVGLRTGIDPVLAADGVDEYLGVHLPFTSRLGSQGAGYSGGAGVLRIACTDVDREWRVQLAAPQPRVVDGEDDPDATMRGPASDLLLVLWERQPVSAVETSGHVGLVTDLVAYVDTT